MRAVTADCDLCVIGGGEAGFAAAIGGIGLGLKVTLIDAGQSEPCWRNWDIALAVLRRSGSRAACRRDMGLGEFRAELRRALAAAAPDRRFARLSAMNVRVLHGLARFAGADAVEVQGQTVRARRFVLATGQGAVQSQRSGDVVERLLGPETIDRFLAQAGDARSVALAQGLRRLGLEAAVHAPAGLLPDIDPELTQPLRHVLRREGVRVEEGSREVDPRGFSGQGSLVHAPPTRPVLTELCPGTAGIALVGGRLVLSPALRTSNPRVYAIGFLAGARSTQASQAQAAVVLKAAFFRLPARFDAALIPYCIETEPGIGTIGQTEAEARAAGAVTVCRWPLAETVTGAALGLGQGHVKIVAGRHGRVLGAGVVGPAASEQIAFWTGVVQARMTLAQVAGLPLPASSLSDASRRAAVLHVARRLQNPWLKRALSVLSRLG